MYRGTGVTIKYNVTYCNSVSKAFFSDLVFNYNFTNTVIRKVLSDSIACSGIGAPYFEVCDLYACDCYHSYHGFFACFLFCLAKKMLKLFKFKFKSKLDYRRLHDLYYLDIVNHLSEAECLIFA